MFFHLNNRLRFLLLQHSPISSSWRFNVHFFVKKIFLPFLQYLPLLTLSTYSTLQYLKLLLCTAYKIKMSVFLMLCYLSSSCLCLNLFRLFCIIVVVVLNFAYFFYFVTLSASFRLVVTLLCPV
jgi:hypothetical protein